MLESCSQGAQGKERADDRNKSDSLAPSARSAARRISKKTMVVVNKIRRVQTLWTSWMCTTTQAPSAMAKQNNCNASSESVGTMAAAQFLPSKTRISLSTFASNKSLAPAAGSVPRKETRKNSDVHDEVQRVRQVDMPWKGSITHDDQKSNTITMQVRKNAA